MTKGGINIFYCYAHKDKLWRDAIQDHLAMLSRSGRIRGWHDGEIVPGSAWQKIIFEHLDTADIILLLISAEFLKSDYCYCVEMMRALGRHSLGYTCVIPILVRHVDFEGAPFAALEMLPTDAKPIIDWPRRDKALKDVAQGIRRAVEKMEKRALECVRTVSPVTLSSVPFPHGNEWLAVENKLREARLEKYWLQEQVVELLLKKNIHDIPDVSMYNRVENGGYPMKVATVQALCQIFQATEEELGLVKLSAEDVLKQL